MRLLRGLSDLVALFCRVIIVGCVVATVIVLFTQIVLRYVFQTGLPWAEELAVTMCAWIVFVGAGLGLREGYHVRLSFLMAWLPDPAARFVERLIQAVCLGFGVALAYAGYILSQQSVGMESATLGVPVWVFYSVTVLSGAIIAFFALENIILGTRPEYSERSNV